MKIEIKNITKIYPRGKKKALNGVNIEIGQGIFGLIGRNGAGKTTLMRIVATIMDATDGEIYFDGKELKANKDEFRSSLGYLPQSTKLMPRMNIVEFLDYVCILKGIKNKAERKEKIANAIETVGLVGEEKKRLGKYSGGMLRRAGIAQALIGNPKVIIFDEPTIGLDPKQIIEIRNLIRTLGKGHTVILSTHILQEVQAVCDRIVIINKGKIVADELTENISRAVENNRRFNVKICGPSREVLATLKSMTGIVYAEALAERDGEAYTYMVESEYGVDVRKKLFYTMAERGWAIIGLEALGMSLEDIFITVVDKSADERAIKPGRAVRRRSGTKDALEKQVAETLVQDAVDKRAIADTQEVEDEE